MKAVRTRSSALKAIEARPSPTTAIDAKYNKILRLSLCPSLVFVLGVVADVKTEAGAVVL